MGSVLGLLVPISLVWAQYVHPLNFPKIPQIEQISSDYLLNIPLENALEELEQDSEWIKLKEEAFHSDYEMQSTNLNGLNSSYEDFGMLDEFKNAEISISSIQLEKPLFKPFGKSSYPESDHTFALTNLIKSSLKHTTTPPINNPIDTIWIESSHQEDISGEIETYPSPTSVFIRNSPVKHIANHGMTPGESSNKQTTETLSYNEVLTSYTQYSGITFPSPLLYYNIFETDALEIFTTFDSPFQIDSDLSGSESMGTPSLRQRRTSHDYNSSNAYEWEINDFDGSSVSNSGLMSFANSINALDPAPKFKLNVIANDGIDSLEVLAWGHIGGNALSDFSETNGFKFLTHNKNNTTIGTGDVSGSFDLRVTDATTGQTGINSWLNDPSWHTWGVWAADSGDTREFFLTYDYNPLSYSAVPEPSTYFMTGILFCFIGCNRASRNTIKTFLSKVFTHRKTKDKIENVQDRIS